MNEELKQMVKVMKQRQQQVLNDARKIAELQQRSRQAFMNHQPLKIYVDERVADARKQYQQPGESEG